MSASAQDPGKNPPARPACLEQIPADWYPFQSRFWDRGQGARMHYLDEGQGTPVVMVHGNPTWSFYYRNLAQVLRDRHRVIVPDHIGCGGSDKPGDEVYRYTLASRVDDLTRLLQHLGVTRDVTLVLHDWGGMIGMAWAAQHVEAVARVVLLNTAAFRLPSTRNFHWQLRAARDMKVGALLVRGGNAFARVAAQTCCTRNPMPSKLKDAYCAPYDSWEHRIATLRFVQDIPLSPSDPAYKIVADTEALLPRFAHTPAMICWGQRDFVFDDHFLKVWEQTWPHAQVHRFPDCGHYILEDAKDEVIPLVETFLRQHPLASEVADGAR